MFTVFFIEPGKILSLGFRTSMITIDPLSLPCLTSQKSTSFLLSSASTKTLPPLFRQSDTPIQNYEGIRFDCFGFIFIHFLLLYHIAYCTMILASRIYCNIFVAQFFQNVSCMRRGFGSCRIKERGSIFI